MRGQGADAAGERAGCRRSGCEGKVQALQVRGRGGGAGGINTVQECIVIVWGQQWRVGNGMHQEGSTW